MDDRLPMTDIQGTNETVLILQVMVSILLHLDRLHWV